MPFLLKLAGVCLVGGFMPFILAPFGVPPLVMLGLIFALSFSFGYLDKV